MVGFSKMMLVASAAAGALATSTTPRKPRGGPRPGTSGVPSKRSDSYTTSTEGTSGGYFFSFWTNGEGDVTYTNGDAGEYSVVWSGDAGDFTAGKGWATGEARDITFSGDFSPDGNGYLSVYGWTEDDLVEYYIVESYGDYNPGTAGTEKGTVNCDGSDYTIYTDTQTDQPSVSGTATFPQYWSVRSDKRTSGTVTTSCHFDAWTANGLELGSSYNYQIVSTEGYESSGTSDITVS